MAFIHEQHPLAGNIVQQRRGRFSGTPSGQMAGIVFDPAAIAQFFHHLEIEHGPLVQPARFQEFVLLFQRVRAFLQFRLDAVHGMQQLVPGLDVMGFRIDGHPVVLFQNASGDRIDLGDGIDFVAEHLNSHRIILIGREHLYDIAACPEESPLQAIVLAGKLHFNQAPQDLVALDVLSLFQKEKHPVIGFRRTQTVDARNAGDDDAVLALKQRPRCGVAQPVDLVVDQRVLFDVGVRGRDVGFRLVVVVVGHEIFDGIFGKERFELAVQLRGESFVVSQNQSGALQRLDRLGHRERLARSRDSEQDLVLFPLLHAADQAFNRVGLVAARLKVRADLKSGGVDQRFPVGNIRICEILICVRFPGHVRDG